MNNFNDDYFVIELSPHYKYTGLLLIRNEPIFNYSKPIQDMPLPIKLKLEYRVFIPAPDVFYLNGGIFVSHRTYECLDEMNLYGLQLFPTDFRLENVDYYFVHIWNELKVIEVNPYYLDKYGCFPKIKSLSFDCDRMMSVPLSRRKIFRLQEAPFIKLIHSSVYKSLFNLNLNGLLFYKLTRWSK